VLLLAYGLSLNLAPQSSGASSDPRGLHSQQNVHLEQIATRIGAAFKNSLGSLDILAYNKGKPLGEFSEFFVGRPGFKNASPKSSEVTRHAGKNTNPH
jgi:hypothetical protein